MAVDVDAAADHGGVGPEAPRPEPVGQHNGAVAACVIGDVEKAADGDPPALLRKILKNPELLAPVRKGGKKAVWHSGKRKGAIS